MVGNCCGDAELRLNLGMTMSGKPSTGSALPSNRSVRDFDEHDAARLDASAAAHACGVPERVTPRRAR